LVLWKAFSIHFLFLFNLNFLSFKLWGAIIFGDSVQGFWASFFFLNHWIKVNFLFCILWFCLIPFSLYSAFYFYIVVVMIFKILFDNILCDRFYLIRSIWSRNSKIFLYLYDKFLFDHLNKFREFTFRNSVKWELFQIIKMGK
jgi:hypothetical protein